MELSLKQFNVDQMIPHPRRSNPNPTKNGKISFLRTVSGKTPNAPVAFVKRGKEVLFHKVPFVDETGNPIRLDTKRIGSRTIVQVKPDNWPSPNEKKNSIKGDSSLWKEQWLSLNKSVDQAIPNFKQLANIHLRETRDLRRGILMGKIDTPGRKLGNNNSGKKEDESSAFAGSNRTDALAELVAAARLVAGRTCLPERASAKKLRSDDSKILFPVSSKPSIMEKTSRQAILGNASTHRKEGDKTSLPLEKPIKKFQPPTMTKENVSTVKGQKRDHQVIENHAIPAKTPRVKSQETITRSAPLQTNSKRSVIKVPEQIVKQHLPDGQTDRQVKMMIQNGWRIHTPRKTKNKSLGYKQEKRVSPKIPVNLETKIAGNSSRNLPPTASPDVLSPVNPRNPASSVTGMQAVVAGIQNLQEVLSKIRGRAQLLTQNSRTILQVQLRPQNLGILSIEIRENGGKYDITVKAQSREAVQAIEAQTEQIRQQLHQSGVDIMKFEVSADDSRLIKHRGHSDEKKQSGDKPSPSDKTTQEESINWSGLRLKGLALGTNTVDFIG